MPLFRKNKSQASLSEPQEQQPQQRSHHDRIRNRDNNNSSSHRSSGSAVAEPPLRSTTTDFAPPTPTAQTPQDISTREYPAPHSYQHHQQPQYPQPQQQQQQQQQQRYSYTDSGFDNGARRQPPNNNNSSHVSSDSRNTVRQRFSYISHQLQGKPTLRVVPAPTSATAPPSATVPEESGNQIQNWSENENLNSWPSSPNPETVSPQLGSEPRKSKRSTFGLHSSSSTSAPPKKSLGRGLSVRRKSPVAQQTAAAGRTSESDRSRLSLDYQRPHSGYQVQDSGSDQQILEQEEHALGPQMPQPSSRRLQTRSPYIHTNHPNRYSSYIPQSPVAQDPAQNIPGNPDPELFYQQEAEVDSSHSQVSSQRLPPYQGDSQAAPQPVSTPFAPRKSSSSYVTNSQFSSDQLSLNSYDPRLDTSASYPRPGSQQSFGPPSPINPQFQQSSDLRPQTPIYRRPTFPTSPPSQQQAQQQPQGDPAQLDNQAGLNQTMDPNQQQPQQQQQQQQLTPNQNAVPYPPPPGGPPQGASFKSNLSQQSIAEQGRDTPPPSKGRDDEIDAKALLQKHEELQAKYMKVKRYFFERDAQVQQLQNTVAHQRMATSRTVLDDDEYATRFNRLEGAIKDLAFNIRKDWRSIPPWLQPVVNEDAHTVGTKEMTAVGRACITRWLVDEVFDRFFHPSLEPGLSSQLKIIEKNVRRTGKVTTEEDKENHLSRISAWRRTTIDGLGEMLQSRVAEEHYSNLSHNLVEKLTASLEINLNEPPPPGLQNSVSMIVELAVGIAAKIPMESRDVIIDYPLPGTLVKESCMKVETTLPPLTNPGADDRSPTNDKGEHDDPIKDLVGDSDREKDSSSASTGGSARDQQQQQQQQQQPAQPPKEVKKKSVFGNLMGKKNHPGSTNSATAVGSREAREREEMEQREREREREKERENNEARIRFAAFLTVEVKGKSSDIILTKAPVYPLS